MSEMGEPLKPQEPQPMTSERYLGEIKTFIQSNNTGRKREGIVDILEIIALQIDKRKVAEKKRKLIGNSGFHEGADPVDVARLILTPPSKEEQALNESHDELVRLLAEKTESMRKKRRRGDYHITSGTTLSYHTNLSVLYMNDDSLPEMEAQEMAVRRMTALLNPPQTTQ